MGVLLANPMIQTLVQAVHLAHTGKSPALARAIRCLDGLPDGSDAAEVESSLPRRKERTYTLRQLLRAAYSVEAGVYRMRPESDAMAEAVRIECESADRK